MLKVVWNILFEGIKPKIVAYGVAENNTNYTYKLCIMKITLIANEHPEILLLNGASLAVKFNNRNVLNTPNVL
jgi:hypothetical protein